jgi:peptidoglycan/xylan/chitin deacetylase (PgdA/CDA1 family)
MEKTQQLLQKYAGIHNTLFRFPGGCYDNSDISKAEKLGLTVIQWDDVSGDSYLKNPNQIEQQVIQNVRNGSIIIFHLHGGPNAPYTAQALPTVISTLKEKGYEFVKLSELINPTQAKHIDKIKSVSSLLDLAKK